jgi:hypothetical protein
MKLPLSIAQKLLNLQDGEKLPLSKLKHTVVTDMLSNGVLVKEVQGRSKNRIFLADPNSLTDYLKNHFGIDNLADYVIAYQKDSLSRAEAIAVASNSKLKVTRTFEGFLVNSYQHIECTLNSEPIIIYPKSGTFTFIHNYKNFFPPSDTTIIGVENAENFREIEKQKYLFRNINPLFVSRYPQNQNKDLLKWLQMIPNSYLHFGDFDFSGLNIYWNEYKKHLLDKARYFIPANIEQLISSKGNRDLYDNQQIQFKEVAVDEIGITTVLKHIRKHKKGLEQEIFIKETK